MNANEIIIALKNKFRNPEYSFFTEVRTNTGATAGRYIDAVAVGLWANDENVYCFEVKIDRNDFLKDIRLFHRKQMTAFMNCNLFYFVTPFNLVKSVEVPENCGLMEVQKGGRIVIKKIAKFRNIESIEIPFLRSLSRHILKGSDETKLKHTIKFLGKEMSSEQFEKYVDNEVQKKFKEFKNWEMRFEVERKVQEQLEKNEAYKEAKELLKALGIKYRANSINPEEIIKHLKKYQSVCDFVKRNFFEINEVVSYLKIIEQKGGENGH